LILRILGSAAGGGVPQWNCSCANCNQTRAGGLPRRTQSGAALSADGVRWLLLNCSPDIASQIEAFSPLQPRSLRETPIAGVLFTDANVDHIGGLATLRQSGPHRFVVRSSSITREIAVAQPAFARFARAPHTWIDVGFDRACESIDNADLVENEILVRGIPVPGTTPGYAGRRALTGATVAYEIRERGSGRRLVFAPIFGAIDNGLFEAISRADVAFLDGSFYSDDELVTNGLLDKCARQLGHQPVGGTDGTLARLHGVRTRIVFTHLNNSNPMLDPNSHAALSVKESGAEIAYDGMEISL
jgi:pyrroloquinoline quinone biosynthesis protein B